MTTVNTVYTTEIKMLIDSSISTTDKTTGFAAKLAVAFWNAANTQEVDNVKIAGYASGQWSKTATNEYLSKLATEFSVKYRDAVQTKIDFKDEKNLSKKREKMEEAQRHQRAAMQALTRSLMVAAWLLHVKPTGVTVKLNGSLNIESENAELKGIYTLRGVEDTARKFFRPSNGLPKARKTDADGKLVPTVDGDIGNAKGNALSLKVCAQFVAEKAAGKARGDLGKETDAVLQSTLAVLLGYFAGKATGGLDYKMVDKVFTTAAAA
jgi:hypothetical protein